MKVRLIKLLVLSVVVMSLLLAPSVLAGPGGPSVKDGKDVKVTDDNNNVDGGLANVTPSKDAQNRQSNEPTVAISGAASPVTGEVGDIIASGANDYRMVPYFGDSWMPVYLSFDGGATWFGAAPFPNGYNTMVPGFPTDTSPEGLSSPIKDLDGSGDPVVRFDAAGNLYIAGIAFNRNFDQPDRPVDNVVYVTKYNFTPGTEATASTTTTAGSPPHFTYAGTTIVDRGAVGFAIPNQPFAFAGQFVDKEWMELDLNSPAASPCAGSVYVSFTSLHGVGGSFPMKFSRSSDGGASFSQLSTISTGGQGGTVYTQGSDIAVASDGTIYVAYRTFTSNSDQASIQVVKSTDCGSHWSQPVSTAAISAPQAPGVAFRTPTFAFVAVDNTDPDVVYVAYQSFAGDYDIYVQRSIDGGATWGAPVQVNTDPGARHQIWPTIEVSNGALHVAWYDFRNSTTPANEALDVFYACTNCGGNAYPTFSSETRVTDKSHNGNCQMFGGGSVAFHGDYIELDARWDGENHVVHVAWTDNRDVPAKECDLTPGPGDTNSVGNRNQNIYADTLVVAP
ncbi:MAG TPA: sialidase family protein [Anaerolineae bacterium]|nr:sialidase family protein [Anaerolineae bacterium]